ncbi:MAG: hypothetical protein IH571_05390 [Acholeplasmataceae bacterium]|nr:hypothetical protein [Acholeplasmataceae bacterium]
MKVSLWLAMISNMMRIMFALTSISVLFLSLDDYIDLIHLLKTILLIACVAFLFVGFMGIFVFVKDLWIRLFSMLYALFGFGNELFNQLEIITYGSLVYTIFMTLQGLSIILLIAGFIRYDYGILKFKTFAAGSASILYLASMIAIMILQSNPQFNDIGMILTYAGLFIQFVFHITLIQFLLEWFREVFLFKSEEFICL